MLFETQKQADTYIVFTQEEEVDNMRKLPVRSYYCNLCGGWHVTSNPNVEFFENFKSEAEIIVDEYLESRSNGQAKKAFAKSAEYICKSAKERAINGDQDHAVQFILERMNNAILIGTDDDRFLIVDTLMAILDPMLDDVLEHPARVSPELHKKYQRYMHRLRKVARPYTEQLYGELKSMSDKLAQMSTLLSPKEKITEPQKVFVEIPMTEDELLIKQQEEIAKAEIKRQRQKEKKLEAIEHKFSLIETYITLGQHYNANCEVHSMVKKLTSLAASQDYKELILPLIERLMELKTRVDKMN